MKVCAIDSKECWQEPPDKWMSNGGFPLQMRAIASLFDAMDLLIVGSEPKEGGMPLPEQAEVFPLRRPTGVDARRKLSVLCHLPYYFGTILDHCKRADVIHVPPPGDLQFLGLLAALWLRKRLIVRYCGSWHPTEQTTLMNRVTRLFMRSFAGGRNVMLATGGGTEPPAHGVSWIFASALSQSELAAIQPDLDRGLAVPPRLIYAGRLSPEKGVATLVTAMAELKCEGFDPLPILTLAGDGPARTELENRIRTSQCADRIRLAGQLNRTELSSAFLQADLCVQPSLSEGFSKAWLDAMAHGLPVLASEVGAARDVIGSNGERGWVIPPGNPQILKETLKKIICCKIDWHHLRRRCREFVEDQTLEAWARKIGERCVEQWGIRWNGPRLIQG